MARCFCRTRALCCLSPPRCTAAAAAQYHLSMCLLLLDSSLSSCRTSSASSTAPSGLHPSRWFGERFPELPPLSLGPAFTALCRVCSGQEGSSLRSPLQARGWGRCSLTTLGSLQVHTSPQPAARRGAGLGPAAHGGWEFHGVHPVSFGEKLSLLLCASSGRAGGNHSSVWAPDPSFSSLTFPVQSNPPPSQL